MGDGGKAERQVGWQALIEARGGMRRLLSYASAAMQSSASYFGLFTCGETGNSCTAVSRSFGGSAVPRRHLRGDRGYVRFGCRAMRANSKTPWEKATPSHRAKAMREVATGTWPSLNRPAQQHHSSRSRGRCRAQEPENRLGCSLRGGDAEDDASLRWRRNLRRATRLNLSLLLAEPYASSWMFDRAACWRLRLTKP